MCGSSGRWAGQYRCALTHASCLLCSCRADLPIPPFQLQSSCSLTLLTQLLRAWGEEGLLQRGRWGRDLLNNSRSHHLKRKGCGLGPEGDGELSRIQCFGQTSLNHVCSTQRLSPNSENYWITRIVFFPEHRLQPPQQRYSLSNLICDLTLEVVSKQFYFFTNSWQKESIWLIILEITEEVYCCDFKNSGYRFVFREVFDAFYYCFFLHLSYLNGQLKKHPNYCCSCLKAVTIWQLLLLFL